MKSGKIFGALVAGIALAPLVGCVAPATLADNEPVSLESQECEALTGTRIRTKATGECRPSTTPFKSYSAEELRSTGEADLGNALRQIDPSFR